MKKLFILISVIMLSFAACQQPKQTASTEITDMPRVASADSVLFEAFADSLYALIEPTPGMNKSFAPGLYSVVVAQHGNVIFERYFGEQSPDTFYETFSIGKTLVALAAGLAYDEGKLDLNARVVDFFPDKVPANLPDSMSTLTVRQLLTMQSGFEENDQLMSVFNPSATGKDSIDWVLEYFKTLSGHRPGTYFYYNLFSTYLVCDILYQLTHKDLVDCLTPNVLEPMHINRIDWVHSPQGICAGGWGAKLCSEDMIKIGQLMLQHGKWNGTQLVSEEWMDMMTANLVESAPNTILTKGNPQASHQYPGEMHSMGYGFFVWQGAHNTYRAEGAGGQFIVVFPDQDAVLLILANTTLTNDIFDKAVWPLLLPVLNK